jgi:hypothetical protein
MSQILNLFLVSSDPDFFPTKEAQEALLERLSVEKLADVLGDVVGSGERLIDGGVAHVRLDIPKTPVVWGNRSGGFKVSCADCGGPMVREFNEGLAAWKAGSESRRVSCVSCGQEAMLENLRFRPVAALGRIAIAFRDTGGTQITPMCRDMAEQLLGEDFLVVLSRG